MSTEDTGRKASWTKAELDAEHGHNEAGRETTHVPVQHADGRWHYGCPDYPGLDWHFPTEEDAAWFVTAHLASMHDVTPPARETIQ